VVNNSKHFFSFTEFYSTYFDRHAYQCTQYTRRYTTFKDDQTLAAASGSIT